MNWLDRILRAHRNYKTQLLIEENGGITRQFFTLGYKLIREECTPEKLVWRNGSQTITLE